MENETPTFGHPSNTSEIQRWLICAQINSKSKISLCENKPSNLQFRGVLLKSKLSKPSKPVVYFLAVLVIKSKPQFFQKIFKTKK